MKKAKTKTSSDSHRKMPPALTPEGRENQMISLATDLAEEWLLNGTAPSQVVTHFLKLGTMKERLEREKLEEENKLLRAKTAALEAEKERAVDYKRVINAMKRYNGFRGDNDEDDYEYEYDD